QDAIISGGRAPAVVIGLQTINRDHQVKAFDLRPSGWDLPEGARHELHFDAHLAQARQQNIHLPEAHQWIAADNPNVHRSIPARPTLAVGEPLLPRGIIQTIENKLAESVTLSRISCNRCAPQLPNSSGTPMNHIHRAMTIFISISLFSSLALAVLTQAACSSG